MKKLFSLSIIVLLFACKKEDSIKIPQANIDNAEQLKSFVQSGGFVADKYYSANEDLQLAAHIKDDSMIFNGNKVSIHQRTIKIAADNSEVITRDYSIVPDANGVAFRFLTHEYLPLEYRLVSIAADRFTVYAMVGSEKVFTEYRKL